VAELDAEGKLLQAFQAEVEGLRNWYDVAVQQRGRTTADTTGLTPEGVADFIAAFARGEEPENPLSEVPLGTALKMASEDLKAYYNESVTAQPSRATDLVSLANWFWGEAAAARVLNQVRKHCLRREGQEYQRLGNGLLVPRRQLHRFEAQLTVVYLSSPRRCSGGVEEALELGVSVSILSKVLSSSLRHRHCRVQLVRCHCPNGDRAIQRTR